MWRIELHFGFSLRVLFFSISKSDFSAAISLASINSLTICCCFFPSFSEESALVSNVRFDPFLGRSKRLLREECKEKAGRSRERRRRRRSAESPPRRLTKYFSLRGYLYITILHFCRGIFSPGGGGRERIQSRRKNDIDKSKLKSKTFVRHLHNFLPTYLPIYHPSPSPSITAESHEESRPDQDQTRPTLGPHHSISAFGFPLLFTFTFTSTRRSVPRRHFRGNTSNAR